MKHTTLRSLFGAGLLLAACQFAQAQFVWTNAAGSSMLSDSGNWAGGVAPTGGEILEVASNDLLGFDTGGPFTAYGLVVDAGFTASLLPVGAETLLLDQGGITNLGAGLDIQLSLVTIASQSWSIGSGFMSLAQSLDLQSGILSVSLAAGGSFNFASSSGLTPDWVGQLNFTGLITSTSIQASSLSLSEQNLSHITINGSAVYLSDGYLLAAPVETPPSAVPEPSTYALAGALGLLGLSAKRRFQRKQA